MTTAMRFEVAPLREIELAEVVEIEELTGLNRWGYDAYRRELLTNPMAAMYVARALDEFSGRRIFGFVAASVVYDELHINNIATHPNHWRAGVGRALLDRVLDEGKMRGTALCVLEVRASNTPAQTLYTRFGFTTARRRRDYYRNPPEDALEMILKM